MGGIRSLAVFLYFAWHTIVTENVLTVCVLKSTPNEYYILDRNGIQFFSLFLGGGNPPADG